MNIIKGGILSIIILCLLLTVMAENESLATESSNTTVEDTPEVVTTADAAESFNATVEMPESNDLSSNTVHNTSTTEPVVTLSVVANPEQGITPLKVQFTAVANGRSPISYSWDFQGDGTIDSTSQNPSFTYAMAGNYTAMVTATDAASVSATEQIMILASSYNSKLVLDSYFPTEFNKGPAQITFIVFNDGTETVNNIAARIVGEGIEYLTSTTLPTLSQGDKDTITVKVNILKSGKLSATAKILDKNFPLMFDVTQQVEYDKISMSAELAALKQQLDEQEKTYYDKKADGYLVSEMADQIKDLKEQVLETEQQLFTGKLADASVGLYIGKSAISDLSNDLQSATKLKVTPLQWLKENAVAIAAIIAAFGTISGLLIKAKHKAAKAAEQAGKFGKEMAQKKWFGKKGEVKDQPAASPPVEEEAGGNPLIDEEKESKD
ncbi:MAG TPA: PKD domain-containing protein [Candidatus Nanoarchaeia archaeon]|nr:PKD domain-containing protein [Candidatus Nanoarchaeia archaeon]